MDINDIRLTPEEIHKITDHWNPIPSRVDGFAPEVIELKVFQGVADTATKKAIEKIVKKVEDIISNPLRVNYRLSEISEYLETLKKLGEE